MGLTGFERDNEQQRLQAIRQQTRIADALERIAAALEQQNTDVRAMWDDTYPPVMVDTELPEFPGDTPGHPSIDDGVIYTSNEEPE